MKKFLWIVLICAVTLILNQFVFNKHTDQKLSKMQHRAMPVEASVIERGAIILKRTFSGTLEAQTDFVVAPKINARIKRLAVDLADTVSRGQIVAELDDEEYIQAVAQAKAELDVANANLVEAKVVLEIANRNFNRIKTLRKRGIASESKFDETKASQSNQQARYEVAKAQVSRASALLETANIRLGYTKIKVDWNDGDDQRIVAERYMDEGHTVSANAALFRIVELDPIIAVIFITEKDYARMQQGQLVRLVTDAYPAEIFKGHVIRISPIFRHATRQARVELKVANPLHRLKPGMFTRVTVEFENIQETTIIPEQALTKRGGENGIFLINDDNTVKWRSVKIGIKEGNRVQIMDEGITGQVVTLGHQLLDDGSLITIPN